MNNHTPESHSLVRDLTIYTAEGRLRAGRPNRQQRPPNAYTCSCGATLGGSSRREAHADHLDHRAHVRARAEALRTGLSHWAAKAGRVR